MYYNEDDKYRRDAKTTIEYTAAYGTCDFLCFDCEICKECDEYNNKDNDGADLDQKKFRMKAAKEYLMRKKAKSST